jgi:hypothetical protein
MVSEEQAPVVERRGIPRLLWGMIVRPRATLEYLNEHGGRTWLAPVLLAVLLAILPVVVAGPITARQAREAAIAIQEQMGEQWEEAEMSAEQQDQMDQIMSITASPLITVIFPAALGVVGLVIGWLVWGGVLHLAGVMLGGRSTFGQMFRAVTWTWLPYVLRGLLQTVFILVSGQLIANPGLSGLVQDTRPVSEMVFAPPSPSQMILVAFLSRVDLFLVWNLVLLATGVMVTARLSRRKAVVVTLGVWLLLTALSLIPTLIGGFFIAQQGAGF